MTTALSLSGCSTIGAAGDSCEFEYSDSLRNRIHSAAVAKGDPIAASRLDLNDPYISKGRDGIVHLAFVQKPLDPGWVMLDADSLFVSIRACSGELLDTSWVY